MTERVIPFPVQPPSEFKIETGVPVPPLGEDGVYQSLNSLNDLIGQLQEMARNRPDLADKPVRFQASIDLKDWDTSELDEDTVIVACDVGMVGVSDDGDCCTFVGGSVSDS